jgi:hypothetical protein
VGSFLTRCVGAAVVCGDDENTVASHRGAEIGFLHDAIVAGVVWQSLGDLSAEIKNDDLVYQPHHEFHVLFDQQNFHPRSSQRAEKIGQVLLFRLSKTGSRFVKHQQNWVCGQRAGNLDDALLAERKIASIVTGLLGKDRCGRGANVDVVAFLASDEALWITGRTLLVDTDSISRSSHRQIRHGLATML